MLTKKQIEAIEIGGRDDEWEMSGDLSMDDARELRRLALLGLEAEKTRLSPETVREVRRALNVFRANAEDVLSKRSIAVIDEAIADFCRCYPPEEE